MGLGIGTAAVFLNGPFWEMKVCAESWKKRLTVWHERFIQCCQAYDPELPEGYIKLSGLGNRITYIGPLAVAMDEFFF